MSTTFNIALPFCFVGCLTTFLSLHAMFENPQPLVNDAPFRDRQMDQVPGDIDFKEAVDETQDRHRFNDLSWRLFVSLNWPATGIKRGEADVKNKFGADSEHVVWGTWKTLRELYPPDPLQTPPTPWNSYDAEFEALQPAKGLTKDAGKRKILSHVLRLGKVTQAGFESRILPPLVAQNSTYVMYEIRVNEIAYNFIVNNQYYLREKLEKATGDNQLLAFPDGSIVMKAAWLELKDIDEKTQKRFYHVPAELAERVEGKDGLQLRKSEVGLVGLHIAVKTPSKPSWIWSTFEHVDNTEPGPNATRASFSKNDPAVIHVKFNVDELPPKIVAGKPLPANPKPVDVERANAIHPTTHNTNMKYHQSRDVNQTVWANYRLVVTQWVGNTDPGDPNQITDLTATRVFPSGGAANTTIETYRQSDSCLGCHQTADRSRFVFFPALRAFPVKTHD